MEELVNVLKYESGKKSKIKCNDSKVHAANLISSKLLSGGQAQSDLPNQIMFSKNKAVN